MRSKDRYRALPQGTTICAWCDAFEQRTKLAIGVLRKIASMKCADYCCDWSRCSRCLAEETLTELQALEAS